MYGLGAWWLGWILFGVVMLILAGLVGMFPENMKAAEDLEQNDKVKGVAVECVEKEVSFNGIFEHEIVIQSKQNKIVIFFLSFMH